MKFLIYKLYRYAAAQEKTVPIVFNFISSVVLFELWHFAFLSQIIEVIFNIQTINYVPFFKNMDIYALIIILVIGLIINYIIFIQKKYIYKINSYYQSKNYSVIKGNIIFFSYLIMTFIISFILLDK